MRVKRSEYGVTPECWCRGNVRSPRKPADQQISTGWKTNAAGALSIGWRGSNPSNGIGQAARQGHCTHQPPRAHTADSRKRQFPIDDHETMPQEANNTGNETALIKKTQQIKHLFLCDHIVIRRGQAAVSLLASHQGEPGSIPGRVTPGFWQVGIVPDDASGRRVFSGISRFPRPFIPAMLHSHLTSSSSVLKSSLRDAQISQHQLYLYTLRQERHGTLKARHGSKYIGAFMSYWWQNSQDELCSVADGLSLTWRGEWRNYRLHHTSDKVSHRSVHLKPVCHNKVFRTSSAGSFYTFYMLSEPVCKQAKGVRFPAGVFPDFRTCESCRTMVLVGGFSRGYAPFPPALAFRRRSIPRFTLTGSQHLDGCNLSKNSEFKKSRDNVIFLADTRKVNDVNRINRPGTNARVKAASATSLPSYVNSRRNGIQTRSGPSVYKLRAMVARGHLVSYAAGGPTLITAARRTTVPCGPGLMPDDAAVESLHVSDDVIQDKYNSRLGAIGVVRAVGGNNRVEQCRWSAGYLEDIHFPLSLHSGAAPHSPRFTLIGSQDQVSMEQRQNVWAGGTGDPRENPPTRGTVRHDSQMRKSGGDPAGNRAWFALVGGEQPNHCTTAAPP
ncbi:hypothetical protein PR048_022712 [Dryococelus australis]|uniref:Uncharacterized protein n=1 Tax=Dryococelus australis TaxID=614101 RepID=A0ABQ9GS18_9NEOP|nr:hypothetical protein PR048_022712 [Dryococelus australis]